MVLTQTLGREIENSVLNLIGEEAVLVDCAGNCVSNENERNQYDIPKSFIDQKEPTKFTHNNEEHLIGPLNHENHVVAGLILKNGEQEKKIFPLIKSFAELIINQYHENNKPELDSTDKFVIKLLNNASKNDFPYYESEAKVLGYDLSAKRIAVVIYLEGFWEKCLLAVDQPSFERDQVIQNTKRNIESAINGFFSKNSDVIIAYLGNDKFVVFKSVSDLDQGSIKKFLSKSYKAIFEPLKNFRIKNIAVGYGNAYEGVAGLVSAFKEADLSLELGQKIWGRDRSYYFGDLGILTVIGEGDREKNVQFSSELLSKMKNEDLSKTLETFFDKNLNLTETALKMGVHRNTIIYRLNQISKVLGADPRVFEQAMSIKIALLIKRLFSN